MLYNQPRLKYCLYSLLWGALFITEVRRRVSNIETPMLRILSAVLPAIISSMISSNFLNKVLKKKTLPPPSYSRIFYSLTPFSIMFNSGVPARAKRAQDRAPYSWNMVNLFSFGCHEIDRAYVPLYRLYGQGRGDYQKEGRGVSDVSWQVLIFYIGHSQYSTYPLIRTYFFRFSLNGFLCKWCLVEFQATEGLKQVLI